MNLPVSGCVLLTVFVAWENPMELSFRPGEQEGDPATRQGRANVCFCRRGKDGSRLLPISDRKAGTDHCRINQ